MVLVLLCLLVAGQIEAKENKYECKKKEHESRGKKQHIWVAIKATSRLRILHSRASTVSQMMSPHKTHTWLPLAVAALLLILGPQSSLAEEPICMCIPESLVECI